MSIQYQIPDKPSNHAKHILNAPDGIRLLGVARTSSKDQLEHLPNQIAILENPPKGTVVKVLSYNGSGYGEEWWRFLKKAVKLAKKLGCNGLLVTIFNRISRNPGCWCNWRIETDLQGFNRLDLTLNKMTVYCLLHPDASPEECASWYIKQVMNYTGNKGGRPKNKPNKKNKLFREQWIPLAKELRAKGFGWLKISQEINKRSTTGGTISHLGVKKWLIRTTPYKR